MGRHAQSALARVGVSGLQAELWQPSLWDNTEDRERRLLQAVDELKGRFGRKIVQRGTALRKKSNRKPDPEGKLKPRSLPNTESE